MDAATVDALRPLWVPIATAAAAALVLLLDALLPDPKARDAAAARGRMLGGVTLALLVALFGATLFVDGGGPAAGGAYVGGPFALLLDRIVLVAAILGVLGALDDLAAREPRRQGEYYLLLLFSLCGMELLGGARDLLLIVVAFELMSVPLYALAAWAKTDGTAPADRRRPAEAALKLYLVGATSTAFTLFGLSLVVGFAGTARLAELSSVSLPPLGIVGMLLVLGGLGYKLGMAPFHMWIPDTYQGAPTPFVAFLSVAPKAAGVAALSSVFLLGLGAQAPMWRPAIGLGALLTMAVGNFLALPQTDARRLLAYSGIAQMGYVLVAVAAGDAYAVGMAMFFLAAYVATNMGAFLVVHAVAASGDGGDSDGAYAIEALAGLHSRAPLLALSLLLFLLSLAGIPFVVGFWAKLYVFLAAWRAGLVTLVLAGIVLAALGLFYYLRVARAAYMLDAGDRSRPRVPAALGLAIGLCLALVVVAGLWPAPLVEAALAAGRDLLGAAP